MVTPIDSTCDVIRYIQNKASILLNVLGFLDFLLLWCWLQGSIAVLSTHLPRCFLLVVFVLLVVSRAVVPVAVLMDIAISIAFPVISVVSISIVVRFAVGVVVTAILISCFLVLSCLIP